MKCPSCKKAITALYAKYVSISAPRVRWKGVAYVCPACDVVVSTSIDPVALKAELIAEVEALLKKR